MSNQSFAKKLLSVGLTVSTTFWSLGLALLPVGASAATLVSGDLIKASGASVYAYGPDAKRYVFPNEKTFKTWFKDFGTVKTITDAELANIPIGGNVVYRGGTRLVKITTDPKVYAIGLGGKLYHVATEGVAMELYGAAWAQRVDDVPDAFFTNYIVGEAMTTAVPPKGSVVSDGTDMYFINGTGEKQKLETGALDANWFRAEYTLNLNAAKLAALPTGTPILGKVANIVDPAQKELGAGAGTTVTGSVTVSMSNLTPVAGSAIPGGAFYAKVLCLDANNGTNQEVRVTGITVNRIGILADANVAGVLVTDKDGVLHGNNVTFGQSTASSAFASEPIILALGAKTTFCVNVNIGAAVQTGTVGVQLQTANALVVQNAAGQVIVPVGAFPFVSPLQSIVNGAGAIGQLQLSAGAVASGNNVNPTEVDQGVKDLDIAKFRFQEITGNESVELMTLNLHNNGSASDRDVDTVRLIDQNNNIVATGEMRNNEISFVVKNLAASAVPATLIGPNGGYLITEGQLRDFTVRLNTTSTSNSANRTLNFAIQEANDVFARGIETQVGVTPIQLGGVNLFNAFPIGDLFNVVRFRQGNVNLSRATSSLAGKIARGMTNVALASFDVNVFGEDLEFQTFDYAIRRDNNNGLLTNALALTGTIKIQNKLGNNIFSITANDPTNYGTACINGVPAAAITVVNNVLQCGAGSNANGVGVAHNLNSFYTVKAGEVGKITFVGDISQNANANIADSYAVVLTGLRARRVSSNNFLNQVALAIAGNTLTVDASTLTVSANSSFAPQNLVLGGGLQQIASFNLQAGSAEDQRVNAIQIRICRRPAGQGVGLTTANNCAVDTVLANLQAVSNITLMVGGQPIAPSFNIATVAGFTASTNLTVPANTPRIVDVFAVVSTAFPVNDRVGVGLAVTSAVGSGSQTTVAIAEQFNNAVLAQNAGVLNVNPQNDGVVNLAELLHSGLTGAPLLLFQIAENNNSEAINIRNLYFQVRNGGNLNNYKLFRGTTPVGSTSQITNVVGTNHGEVRFTGLNSQVAKGTVGQFQVAADVNFAGNILLGIGQNIVTVIPTYLEYDGAVSGANTRDSGGIAVASFPVAAAPAGADTIEVNDGENFENGDLVRIDFNNDGDFTDNHVVAGVNENLQFTVCTKALIAAGRTTIQLDPDACGAGAAIVDILAAGEFVVGGAITRFVTVISNVKTTEEARLVGSAHASFQDLSQTVTSQVGTFVLASQGNRPIIIDKLKFEVSGSFDVVNGFGAHNYQLWRASNTDGAKTVQIPTGPGGIFTQAAQLVYVPSGTNIANGAAPLVNNGGGIAVGATLIAFDAGTANRSFSVGDRITFRAAAANCGAPNQAGISPNGTIGYRVTQVTTADLGITGSIVITPGVRGTALADNVVICAFTNDAADALVNVANGATGVGSVIIGTNAAPTVVVGDIVSFVQLAGPLLVRNVGQGHRVLAVGNVAPCAAANCFVIVPPLPAALANNDLIRRSSNVLQDTDLPESGAVVAFKLPAGEQIGANSSSTYAVVADTSTMKATNNNGTATLTLRVPGNRGIADNTNGFNWTYTPANGGLNRPIIDISNSYPTNSRTAIY
ncbi:MAG: hypothetical protein G01um101418_381 [Parcubacteria group bacterium Gr01-1014_18]|nr:MAG: hypothetical protein Greene041636_373 [Parcubacteria group bacterium Greene0416_36]TSC81102.1 MAG: hypothetical protein G01um101418_381 [Parcubacteria group bacterium Gr01-1014_18]TSC98482.1 MAG: hypothetical protein Greene101420_719 [Parcubacteria group bacterium Greene1014_20]TSD07353.1 MAG: hypothetical protein Greene07142_208 [Parcubacteria group bacterium Greene0714_2]